MKTFFILLCALCAFVVSPSHAAKTNQIFLTWDLNPDYDSGTTFVLYSQTNVALPVASWKPVTNISFGAFTSATNKVAIPAASSLPVFYTVTASNVLGESDFSQPVEVRLPSQGQGLRIGKF